MRGLQLLFMLSMIREKERFVNSHYINRRNDH